MNNAGRLTWLRNVGSGYANAAVGGIIFVFITPVLVHKLGVAAFAVWVLAQTIIFYLHFFDGGLHNAQVRYHAHFAARGRAREIQRLISTSVLALLASGVLAALCGALVAMSPAPWFRQLSAPLAADFRLVLFILAANLLIDIPAQALENFFEGAQRFDVRNLRMLVFRIVTAAAQLTLLLLGYGIVALALAELACTAASIVVDVLLIRRIFPGVLRLDAGFSWRLWRRIRRYA
ncbi:MAG: lipopolysaccharide biosynthesis protein, partial [Steroidobacteraceae bacterium]